MANLVYRHAGLASTSARVDNDCSDEVIRIINDPDWKERSQTVMSNPTGPEAKKLIKEISPLVRLAGKRVPWSPMERLTASHHIYALYHTFGAPAYFITFAPKTLTNQLMLTFGEMQNPEENHVSLTLPQHLQRRVQLLTSNTSHVCEPSPARRRGGANDFVFAALFQVGRFDLFNQLRGIAF